MMRPNQTRWGPLLAMTALAIFSALVMTRPAAAQGGPPTDGVPACAGQPLNPACVGGIGPGLVYPPGLGGALPGRRDRVVGPGNGDLEPRLLVTVPEPISMVLLGTGLLGISIILRRRRQDGTG
jgi:hypothetical protein